MARGKQRAASDVDLLVVGEVAFGEVVASPWVTAKAASIVKSTPRSIRRASFLLKLMHGHHFLGSVVKQEKFFLIGDDGGLKRLAEKRLARRT